MSASCTRRIQFCAGHRLMNHEGKCAHLHGHNYVVLATAECSEIDSVGRVIDFSAIKEKLGGWIDENWDHGFIAHQDDVATHGVMLAFEAAGASGVPKLKYFGMPYNPTAENMALFLLEEICPQLFSGSGVWITSVRVWETENCYAEASS